MKQTRILLLALLIPTATFGQTQNQPPAPELSRADEMLKAWNEIGNKLIAMAQDFPEGKYDFKVQKDERTFALNLLHAAALDYVLIRRISGANLGLDFGEGDNPSRDQFKTKADVVKFVQEAVADGAKVIQEQDDAGLDKTTKFFGNRLAHNSYIWTFAIEHSAEHYGQLVVYYRANNLIPPDSRRNAQTSQPASDTVFRDCPDCPEMVVIPAGNFTMGSSAEEKSSLKKQHQRAQRLSKVPPFVLYSLRHTFLTRLGESGCDAWTLARIAGHSSVGISSRYVHPSHDAVLSAMETLGGHNFGHTPEIDNNPNMVDKLLTS